MKLSRRETLAGAGAAALMAPWPALQRGPVRVCVALEGGLDALALCAPVEDARYRELRAGTVLQNPIAFAPGAFVNRALAPLVPLLQAGRVGLLRGVGVPGGSRAHRVARESAFSRITGEGGRSEARPDEGSSEITSLEDASRMISSGFSGRISIPVSGFDTHSSQRVRLGELLGELAQGLRAFHDRLGDDWARTRLFTLTEFGRSPAENSTGGTEDGGASAMLILGGGAPGGLLGAAPSLDDPWAIPVTADVREWTARLVAA